MTAPRTPSLSREELLSMLRRLPPDDRLRVELMGGAIALQRAIDTYAAWREARLLRVIDELVSLANADADTGRLGELLIAAHSTLDAWLTAAVGDRSA